MDPHCIEESAAGDEQIGRSGEIGPAATRYRADIDGLRAVAVVAVIAYHAFPRALPGGFIGVDIFFVISGYLISGILFREHGAGTFSFQNFYARRIKRIFPSLIAMLVLVLAYGWLALLPSEYQDVGRHGAAGSIFAQNIALLRESGYFDTAASLKPLLHLWSLAVEEQMYLFLPPLLVFVWRRNFPIVPVIGVLAACSLGANLYASERFPAAAFFLMPYRAWEFFAGTLLAVWHDRQSITTARPYRSHALAVVGSLLLATGFGWFAHGDAYPGWRALVPVAGAIALIAAGPLAWLNRRVLSQPALVWIGLISYPLYLFHWPLISFVHIIRGATPDPTAIGVAVALAVGLSIASYYALERRIRHSKSPWTVPLLVLCFLGLGVVGYGVWRGNLPPPSGVRKARQHLNAALAELKNTGHFQGWQNPQLCDGIPRWTIGGDGPQTLVVGDSHGHMLAPRIHELLHDGGKSSRGAVIVTKAGACPLPGITSPTREFAENLIPMMRKEVASNPAIDRVVIVALWPHYFSECWKSPRGDQYFIDGVALNLPEGQEMALSALGAMVRQLVAGGKKVTVVLTVPFGKELSPRSGYRRSFLGGLERTTQPLSVATFRQRHGQLNDAIATIARASGADVIDPVESLQ
ncbi:MAG: acyltransferase, partial [Planctomycetes bacterium]|nr:acyltransferase [Planctomycetota bacterium]